jgi:nucleoside-diphosphate-sugar epimerase
MVAELTELRRRQGLRVSIMTPGMVYGSQGVLRETIDLLRRKQYRVFGDGLNWWSFVHVDDVAEAYLLALTRRERGGDYFLADDRPLRRRQAIDLVCDALKLRRVGGAPTWIVRLMIGSPLVEAATSSIRMRNTRAKEQLNWSLRYTTLADGLPAAIEEID